MRYTRTVTEQIEVVAVYDPDAEPKQHPDIYSCDDGESYLVGTSDKNPLREGDWIVHPRPYPNMPDFRIIPVAEQEGWVAE